jgi:hypothetical protein
MYHYSSLTSNIVECKLFQDGANSHRISMIRVWINSGTAKPLSDAFRQMSGLVFLKNIKNAEA